MKLLFEISYGGNNKTLQVELEAFPEWQNDGIGAYEFWGQRGFDEGSDYLAIDDVTYHKDTYTPAQRAHIDAYIERNFEHIEKQFIKKYEKD